MADKNQPSSSSLIKKVQTIMDNLNSVSSSTNHSTYDVTRDLYDTDKILNRFKSIQEKNDTKVRQTVNGNNYAATSLNSGGMLLGGSDDYKK